MTFEVSPRTVFGYALFFLGTILLGYVTVNCIFLANGTIQPLEIEIEPLSPSNVGIPILLGIMTQIGAYALLVVVASILMKTGLNITKS